jgi:hypothetical protein
MDIKLRVLIVETSTVSRGKSLPSQRSSNVLEQFWRRVLIVASALHTGRVQ